MVTGCTLRILHLTPRSISIELLLYLFSTGEVGYIHSSRSKAITDLENALVVRDRAVILRVVRAAAEWVRNVRWLRDINNATEAHDQRECLLQQLLLVLLLLVLMIVSGLSR